MTLEIPGDPAAMISSDVASWTAELKVLRSNPTVKKFLELQDKIDQTDAIRAEVARETASEDPATYRFGPPSNGATYRDRARFGLPANELSSLKADDLEDVVLVHLPELAAPQ